MGITVPRYGGGVQPAPLPQIRVDPRAPIEAFGGGQGAADLAGQSQGVAKEAAAYQQAAQDEADSTRLSEERRQLNKWEYDNIHDPEKGVKATRRSIGAIGVSNDLKTSFTAFIGERSAKLNTRQREAYTAMTDARLAYIKNWAGEYEQQQVAVGRDVELQAANKSSVDRAALDPFGKNADGTTVAELERGIIRDNAAKRAKLLGLGVEASGQMVADAETDLHLHVISGLLGRKDYAGAKNYYSGVKAYIDADGQQKVDRALKDAGLRDLAVEIEREVFQPSNKKDGPPTGIGDAQGRAMAELWKRGLGTDGDARAKVTEAIHARWALDQAAKTERYQSTLKTATNAIEDTWKATGVASAGVIPPDVWTGLTLGDRHNFLEWAEKLNTKEKVQTNPTTYYTLKLTAAYDPVAFLKLNLAAPSFRTKLAPSDLQKMMDIQAGMAEKRLDAVNKVEGWRSMQDKVVGRLVGLGISPDPKDKRGQMVREAVDTLYERAQAAHPEKPVTPEEQDLILNDLTTQIGKSGGWGVNPAKWAESLGNTILGTKGLELPGFFRWTGGAIEDVTNLFSYEWLSKDDPIYRFDDINKAKAELRQAVLDLSPERRKQMEDEIRRVGGTPTPQRILQLYELQQQERLRRPVVEPTPKPPSRMPPMPPAPPGPK